MAQVECEHVLVVPTARFRELGYFQGFREGGEEYLAALLDGPHVSFRPRAEMEQDPSFKQLIPYVILQWTSPSGTRQVFQYTRGSGQGEQRLHRKLSIGIGGHISREDARGVAHGATYQEGMRRELEEEIELDTAYRQRCVGVINDDLTDVGRVHLGVVHLFELDEPRVQPREAELLDAGFRDLEGLRAESAALESWSRICLEALYS